MRVRVLIVIALLATATAGAQQWGAIFTYSRKFYSDDYIKESEQCAWQLVTEALGNPKIREGQIPSRKLVETLAPKMLLPLVAAKYHLDLEATSLPPLDHLSWPGLSWHYLTQPGDGNCGECGGLLFRSMRDYFGKPNVSVVWNIIHPFGNLPNPEVKDHVFFVVRAQDFGKKAERLIVDYSWAQWFYAHEHDDIRQLVPLAFIGTLPELEEAFLKYRRFLAPKGGGPGKFGDDERTIRRFVRAIYRLPAQFPGGLPRLEMPRPELFYNLTPSFLRRGIN